jgi:hypothetical protein
MTKEEIEAALAVCASWERWEMGNIEADCVVDPDCGHILVHRRVEWDRENERFRKYHGPQFSVSDLHNIVTARTLLPTALRALLRAMPVLEAAKEYALWQERFDNCYDMLDFGDCECQEYMTETRKALIAAIREHDREGT